MKKHIETLCWIAGAIVWAIVAWNYYSEGRTGFALLQVAISVVFVLRAVTGFVKHKKQAN